MRLREERLGALNLFANQAYGLIEPDEAVAQALADVATIGILHQRFIHQRQEVSEQVQNAFNARAVLEQAKGVVAAANGMDVDEAFVLLRVYASRHKLLLSEVARRVMSRDLNAETIRSPQVSQY
jgi:AmiR/NasT family two-component response regulator